MKLLDKLADKMMEPDGLNLKEYKKYKSKNSKKSEKIVATIQKQVDVFLNNNSIKIEEIELIKQKRKTESEGLTDLFASELFGNIISELTFDLRVYALNEIYAKKSLRRRKSTIKILKQIREFVILHTLIFVNDLMKFSSIYWTGSEFKGRCDEVGSTTIHYITDYIAKIEGLIKAFETGNKNLIQTAMDCFDVENLKDYDISPFREFPNKYDIEMQKLKEKDNTNELN